MLSTFLVVVSGALVVLCVLFLIHALKMVGLNALTRGWNHDILWAVLSTLGAMVALSGAEVIWHLPAIEAALQ